MKKEVRTVIYDDELRLEAYRFEGIMQPFQNHFHEYYVNGSVENGKRCLSCKNKEYTLQRGNIVLFNPGDNHACVQGDDGTLDYRALNISRESMLNLIEEVTCYLRPLHEMIMKGFDDLGKEENLLLLISLLIQRYGQPFEQCIPECRDEIEEVYRFMEQHFSEHIYLDQICHLAGLSKSTLLWAFTKSKGVTPYSYFRNIRIGEAKKLLEQVLPLVEAALRTGFSDQSHFTNYFNRYIGVSPGVYREIFLTKENSEDKKHGK